MRTSESIKQLASAITKAQAEMQGAKKGSDNPFFKSRYADLGAVMAATKDALHNNGLSIVQFPIAKEGMCGVTTILLHASGEFIEQECLLACSKQDPQAYGSSISYARRYSWQAVCGIPSEDDDGNYATHGSSKPKASKIVEQPIIEQAWDMFDAVKEKMTEDGRAWVADQLKAGNAQGVIDYLQGGK